MQKSGKILYVERLQTPIGILLLTHDGAELCNAEFEHQEARRAQELAHHFPGARLVDQSKRSEFAKALTAYFKGEIRAIDKVPVAKLGTPFQQTAWTSLRQIPAGSTRSYGDQAAKLGKPNAARAVGRANGLNPVSIVVPCHRLIGADGSLVHYGGGIRRKRWLIEHEASNTRSKTAK
ncbi:MAG: methylated-DNA--[protein]-cysteine S-methyltransferase [Micropepsaceae bacterium]